MTSVLLILVDATCRVVNNVDDEMTLLEKFLICLAFGHRNTLALVTIHNAFLTNKITNHSCSDDIANNIITKYYK